MQQLVTVGLAAVLTLALSNAVWAKGPKPPSAQGVKENVWEAFKALDKDTDGKISLDEFKAKFPADEAAKAETKFKELDLDNDGFIQLREFKGPAAQAAKEPGKKQSQKGEKGVVADHRGLADKKADKKKGDNIPGIPAKVARMFKQLDTNGDGKLTLAEFKQFWPAGDSDPADEKFKQLDANHDHKLTIQEFQVSPQDGRPAAQSKGKGKKPAKN